jgi:hypothetical protein
VTRKLSAVAQTGQLPLLLDDIAEGERRGRQAFERVRHDVRQLAEKAQAELFRRRVGNDVRRVSQKLSNILQTLQEQQDSTTQLRDIQWAAKARVARRAGDLKACVNAAGSVYLPRRLSDVRIAVRKLFFACELSAAITDGVTPADIKLLAAYQRLLSQLDDLQTLIDRIRHVQGSLATPDLKAWKDLDRVIMLVETRCRALHARYVRERTAVVALCDRLAVKPHAEGSPKRKVS